MSNVWFIYRGWGLIMGMANNLEYCCIFVNVVAITTLTLGFNKFFSTFEMVWVFVFNVYYGGVSPLSHEPGLALVRKQNKFNRLFYAM